MESCDALVGPGLAGDGVVQKVLPVRASRCPGWGLAVAVIDGNYSTGGWNTGTIVEVLVGLEIGT